MRHGAAWRFAGGRTEQCMLLLPRTGTVLGDGTSGWDQFAVNEKKYNLKSDYSEDFYTTKLDTKGMTKGQIEKAERLAAEIEQEAKTSGRMAANKVQSILLSLALAFLRSLCGVEFWSYPPSGCRMSKFPTIQETFVCMRCSLLA